VTDPAHPRRRAVGWVVTVGLLGAAAAVAAVLVVVLGVGPVHRSSRDLRYVIPAGTAERIAAGQGVEILPAELRLHVGDTITLVNEDESVQQTGFLTVRPHETVSYRFAQAGSYATDCTLHPDGRVQIDVLS
jgi:plastocyanin